WDASTGQEILSLVGHHSAILTVAFSPDGTRIVTASRDGTARIWNIGPSRELQTFVNGTVKSSIVGASLAYSPDGSRLAVAYSDPTAKVWDVNSGRLLLNLAGDSDGVSFVTYNLAGTQIATANMDGTAKVWDAHTGKELQTLGSVSGKYL